ncbi:alpha/beta hydrolase [Clostridium saccharoperbutylacetonicum]|uniref:alpha/beta hydrolase n=1 Tax=Clostridium saccharoperbutylacetonicum TaxID=36745 RepID=UPI0009838EB0|nr:alpha/beta hydrolase-fold protein [Clostridium saccharoperbutylacetonicum]AQR98190.1 enterobactin/ferric enterobactin esterase [Clostridium saccharoperbutylacetonicum]NSB34084.1 S-formylglutathione hydrolase FrmB [Clostridium saccharoperbutylacetonicum]
MAFLQINFYSKTLKKLVNFNALLPIDTIEIPGMSEAQKRSMKAIYLLHGYSGNHHDWVCGSKIQELSLKYNVAVFMPSGENSFYLDDTDRGELFGEFVGNELVEFTRKMFHLSDRREDTFIGGYSMGGYGAIRNGIKYSHNFSCIIALSSALIIRNIAGIPVDYKDMMADYKYYNRVFGDLNQLLGSDKDPEALILKSKKENKYIPKIYMACGTEDFLIKENQSYHDFLVSEGIEHTYIEGPGIHNWDFWNEYIEKAILWTNE